MKRAFTLIELLVVIAIIAILAAILFPVFAQAKLAAKKAASISNLKQLGTATLLYLGDADDNYPQSVYSLDTKTYVNGIGVVVPGSGDRVFTTYDALMPYMKNTGILVSPGKNPGLDFSAILQSIGLRTSGSFRYTSYGPNLALFQDPALPPTLGDADPVVSQSSLQSVVDTVTFYDTLFAKPGDPMPSDYTPACRATWPTSPSQIFGAENFQGDPLYSGSLTLNYADGHAGSKPRNGTIPGTSIDTLNGNREVPTYTLPCDLSGIPGGVPNT